MSIRAAIIAAAMLSLGATRMVTADVEAGVARPSEGLEAMNRMGTLYATGTGVPQDYVAALAWFQRAAQGGSLDAMNNVAAMHFHGLGVPQSNAEAVKWLRLAASKGDAAAMNELGCMHVDGIGVAKSTREAFELFSRAAARGYAPGMANLGHAYANGSGVKRDDERAYALLSAALEIGVPQPEREAALYQLGALSQRLDATQLERARAEAGVLLAKRIPSD